MNKIAITKYLFEKLRFRALEVLFYSGKKVVLKQGNFSIEIPFNQVTALKMDYINGKEDSFTRTTIDESIESHVIGFKAEESRLDNGRTITF